MPLSLPLTAFEQYMLLDGTADHPMDFFFRLRFHGSLELDLDALQEALDAAVRRHPLLAARIDSHRTTGPRFTISAGGPIRLQTAPPLSDPDAFPAFAAIDPARGPLLRFVIVGTVTAATDPDTTNRFDMIAQFHHAACDGLGAVAFLNDFLKLLAARLTALDPQLDPLNPLQLRGRGRYGLKLWSFVTSLHRQARGLEGVWKFLTNKPVRLESVGAVATAAESAESPAANTRCPTACSFTLDSQTTAALRQAARHNGVSLNELLTAALFSTLRATIPATAFDQRHSVIRLCIHMNARQASDRRTPAANIVSMIFLDRSPQQILDAPALLQSIHDEIQLIKRCGLKMTFIFTLWLARLLPGGIRSLVKNQQTAATALFTNLGSIFNCRQRAALQAMHIGRARLVSVEFFPPIRAGTGLGVAVCEYTHALHCTLHSDPKVLSNKQTVVLCDLLRDCLLQRAGVVDTLPVPY